MRLSHLRDSNPRPTHYEGPKGVGIVDYNDCVRVRARVLTDVFIFLSLHSAEWGQTSLWLP